MRLTLLSLLTFVLYAGTLMGQSASFDDWGRGVIAGGDQEDFDAPLRELIGLKIYESPGGEPVGEIKKGDRLIELFFKVWESDAPSVAWNDFQQINYEIYGLNWFEEKQGYIKIGINSVRDGFWINKAALEERGLRNESYVEFVVRTMPTLFPLRIGIRMNMRAKPTTNSAVLTKLIDDHYFVEPTGQSKGLWIEVKVEKWKYSFCEGDEDDKVLESWTGWIKLEDNAGPPNIWFYERGC